MPPSTNPGPPLVIDYFRSGLHTGRGPGLDRAISRSFLLALAEHPRIKDRRAGLAFQMFMTLGTSVRNVDLVIGPRSQSNDQIDVETGFASGPPADVWLGAEWKSIMTEHGKAQRNRRGDLDAHAAGLFAVNKNAVTLGLCVINAADTYFSHTGKGVRDHGDGKLRAARAVQELEQVRMRSETDQPGLDALCLPVVLADNQDLGGARWLGQKPAPADGTQRSWEFFIERAAERLYGRFLK